MLVTVVVVFAFSWLPLYVVHLRLYYGPELETSSLEFSLLVQVCQSVNLLGFLSALGVSSVSGAYQVMMTHRLSRGCRHFDEL